MNDRPNRTTLVDVAMKAGVSTMTVSRVVNKDQRVSRMTRQRVEDAIAALNYVPNLAARTLALGRVQRVCLLYGNPSAGYLGELLLGALEATEHARMSLVVQQAEKPLSIRAVEERFKTDWDALLIPPPYSDNADLQELVKRAGIPAAFISGGHDVAAGQSIGIDDRSAASEATEFLIRAGHRDIGFVRGNPDQTVSELRYLGFGDALRQAGLAENPDWVVDGDFTYQSGFAAGQALLASAHRPTAVLASNDDMAAGLLAAASNLRLNVPSDLSVAGFDDSPIASTIWPSLTTVRQPLKAITQRAVESIILQNRRLSLHDVPEDEVVEEIVPHIIVERSSTAKRGS